MAFDARHLCFDSHLGYRKPESVINRETDCPFCHRDNLTGVIANQWPMLLIKNKYPVLKDTFPTVLIETDDCDGELSTYHREHLHALIEFGLQQWHELKSSQKFKSVLFFKNHGPLSGGTIHHPHMQIVGLKNVDYTDYLLDEHFEGTPIANEEFIEFNVSTKPRIGFFEFNIILKNHSGRDRLADWIQTATHYTLNHFHKACQSYNLFFYEWKDSIRVKVMPRFVTSPVFIGFSIPQVSNRIYEVAEEIHNLYF